MTSWFDAVARIVGAALRLLAGALMAVLALGLLALALVLLVFGLFWALLRGRRPVAPVVVGRFARYSAERVWPGRGGRGPGQATEVVDVEVTEVRASDTPSDAGHAPGLGGPDRP